MSGGAVAALVVGGVVVVGGGLGLMLYFNSRRRYGAMTLPASRVAYGQVAARKGPDLASQLLGSVSSLADAYVSSDAGSQQIADYLSSPPAEAAS